MLKKEDEDRDRALEEKERLKEKVVAAMLGKPKKKNKAEVELAKVIHCYLS